jgi:2-haloacid dehalogenase
MVDFDDFRVITFDCYGTLIDWETGILGALRPMLERHGAVADDPALLETYAQAEAEIEAGPYQHYREVLAEVVRRFGDRFGFEPSAAEESALADSIRGWEPFPDTNEALRRLKTKYKLGIISNIDDELFAWSSEKMGGIFDFVVTAQQVGSYKPSRNNFEVALKRMGLPKEQVLHAAESLYHDVAPTREMGIRNVWVYRRAGKEGFGATKTAEAKPDVKVKSLRELATLAGT